MGELERLRPQARNANKHTPRGMGELEKSIAEDGWIGAITVAADGETFDGSARLETLGTAGLDEPIVVETDGRRPVVVKRTDIQSADEERAKRLALAANKIAADNLSWDAGVLASLAEEMDLSVLFRDDEIAAILDQAGTELLDIAGDDPTPTQARATLAERFGVPPFSVLDARQGYWQARKRAWIALGIQSELGRGDVTPGGGGANAVRRLPAGEVSRAFERPKMALEVSERVHALKPAADQARKRGLARKNGQDLMRGEYTNVKPGQRNQPETASLRDGLTWPTSIHPYDKTGQKRNSRAAADQRSNLNGSPTQEAWATHTGTENMATGTSIFDPVLCELVYRWFCPDGGAILDPFAGGSVRGIVAALLGRQYTGIDLRPEQIAANEEQATAITPDAPPRWIVGDSRDAASLAPGGYDLVFSCPPYADLEVYSDDPRDLSTLEYSAFLDAYRAIIRAAVGMLKDNRFAVFVVGDVRDKKGFYRNFVGATADAFQDAGAILYNEAILVTAVGSLPIRIAKQFEGYRKLGKTHQNVLVFYKGDPKRIKDFGPVEMGLADEGGDSDGGYLGLDAP